MADANAPPNEKVDVGVFAVGAVDVDGVDGEENWNPFAGAGDAVVLPKPGKENPPVAGAPVFGFKDAGAPNIELLVLLVDDESPNTEAPPKFPNIDGLLSYCDAAALGAGDEDSTDGFSSLVVDVCFCNCDCCFSALLNENFMFSLELSGVFGPVDVGCDWEAIRKTKQW